MTPQQAEIIADFLRVVQTDAGLGRDPIASAINYLHDVMPTMSGLSVMLVWQSDHWQIRLHGESVMTPGISWSLTIDQMEA